MPTYFTSDIHYEHRLLSFLRGFDSPEAHDDSFDEMWRSTVGKNDLVWILGDLHMSGYRPALERMAALPGRKRIVLGNHDAAHPMHRTAGAAFGPFTDVFEQVTTAATIRLNGRKVLSSHFPYDGEGRRTGSERFTQWRLKDLGEPLLHGHTHAPDRATRSASGSLQVHVGLDAWDFRLAAETEVLDLVAD